MRLRSHAVEGVGRRGEPNTPRVRRRCGRGWGTKNTPPTSVNTDHGNRHPADVSARGYPRGFGVEKSIGGCETTRRTRCRRAGWTVREAGVPPVNDGIERPREVIAVRTGLRKPRSADLHLRQCHADIESAAIGFRRPEGVAARRAERRTAGSTTAYSVDRVSCGSVVPTPRRKTTSSPAPSATMSSHLFPAPGHPPRGGSRTRLDVGFKVAQPGRRQLEAADGAIERHNCDGGAPANARA